MKKITYTINTNTPVIISDTVGGNNHISTNDFIPGSSILGIAAGRYLQKNTVETPEKDSDFKRLFLSDSIYYRNATLEINGSRSISAPLNIVAKKEADESYIDVFHDEITNTKKVSGYIGKSQIKVPNKTINFHTSRKNNRISGKSEDGEIFTYEGLAGGQKFIGEIIGDEIDLNIISALFFSDKSIRIGRSKTAQYGEAEIEFFPSVEEIPKTDSLNTIVCVSPVIILNKNGVSSTLKTDLEEYLGMKIKDSVIATTVVESFNRKWGSKKPSEAAFAQGSVFQIEGDVSGIIKNGIGIRRNEGFGEVVPISVDLSILKKDVKKGNGDIQKPIGKPPKEVMNLFKEIIKKELFILAEHAGVRDSIKPKMPNSLTSRLLDVFQSENTLKEIQVFVDSVETQKEEGDAVVKKAGEHLKRVKLGHRNIFDILKTAKTEPEHHFNELTKMDPSGFLNKFSNEVEMDLSEFMLPTWIHYWNCLLTCHMKEKK